jgi:hypothetical protein
MLIGFYSRGPVSLPHPPYPKATLRLIEKAIGEAWRIIRERPEGGFNIATADEDTITRELRTCLMNNVLDGGKVHGFTSEQFCVMREAKFESFDGTYLDKMPDLHISIRRGMPVSLPSADGLFAECKPVDRDHFAGREYCDKGIIRFVKGEYAWAMPQGLMIGYASSGYTVPDKLEEAIAKRKAELKTTGHLRACPYCSAEGYSQHPHVTVHKRGFTYPCTKKKAPEITIRHLWFNRS